ncbi:hypothetical protein D3C74_451480 [compost metagenome]
MRDDHRLAGAHLDDRGALRQRHERSERGRGQVEQLDAALRVLERLLPVEHDGPGLLDRRDSRGVRRHVGQVVHRGGVLQRLAA